MCTHARTHAHTHARTHTHTHTHTHAHTDVSAVLQRLEVLTGIDLHKSAHDKGKLINYHPPDPLSAMRFSEGDFERLGPKSRDQGLARAGRAWMLMYKARPLPRGQPKEELLSLAVDAFADQVGRM